MGIGWLLIPFLAILLAIPTIADAQTLIEQLDEKIIEQNKIIKDDKLFMQENIRYLNQQIERSNKSWDALLSIEPAEKELNNAVEKYKNSRTQLKLLLSERSDQYYIIRIQNEELLQEKIEENIVNSSSILVKLIGIDISKSCLISEKCLNFSDIVSLDSSNTRISGDFVEKDGDIRREKSPMVDSWRWYDSDDSLRVIVDPPSGMSDRIKMITISNLGVYFTAQDMILQNNTRIYHEGRYVENCRTAIIDNDLILLDDTINYLRTGCTITDFNSTKSEYIPSSEFDPRTSPNWLFTQWQNESKVRCLGLCFEY